MPRLKDHQDKKKPAKPIRGSGNVFLDLGFSEEEAEFMLFRSELASEVLKTIRLNKWTQVEAAQILGVSQPRVSDFMHGRIDKFSADMLIRWLIKLGNSINIKIKPKRNRKTQKKKTE